MAGKLKNIALKPFWFNSEIDNLIKAERHISAFLLMAFRLEHYCYKLVCKIQSKKENNPNIRFENKKLSGMTFGKLIQFISDTEREYHIDCVVLCKLKKVLKLRNEIAHHILDLDVNIKNLENNSQNICTEAKGLHNEIWKQYINNPQFPKITTKIKN